MQFFKVKIIEPWLASIWLLMLTGLNSCVLNSDSKRLLFESTPFLNSDNSAFIYSIFWLYPVLNKICFPQTHADEHPVFISFYFIFLHLLFSPVGTQRDLQHSHLLHFIFTTLWVQLAPESKFETRSVGVTVKQLQPEKLLRKVLKWVPGRQKINM